jgi:outer membrane receptor protein involved in Fe transport
MKIQRFAVAILALSAIMVTGIFAQATTATLKGKLIDTDGVGLPGVPVAIATDTHGSASKTVMTDIDGRFKFQLLPPANDYYISVNYPGFATTRVGPIDLDPGKTTVQDVTLRTSEELTERIEVVAHGSIVDTESTKSSTTFNSEFIEGLPIIGRNYQAILSLTPGVTDTDGDGNPNVQGARETGLQYRLDGGNVTDPVSGTFGQNFNSDAIEEIEVITAGASAEYGRADGGFANIITKSGGNDIEGSFKLIWRGKMLDGDGAGENVDTFLQRGRLENDLRDTRPYGTIGGALKKDKLWYFVSLQYTNTVLPLSLAGTSITRSRSGWNNFGKLTWQVNSDNKLALQVNTDPADLEGLFIGFGTSPDSDGLWHQGGQTWQLRWTSIISPTLLLETLFTSFDSGISVTPISDQFHEIGITSRVNRVQGAVTIQADYPLNECSTNGEASGFIPNCDPALAPAGTISIAQFDLINGTTTGPLPFEFDDSRTRNAIKTDLTYTIEDAWGEHQLKSGLEFADEKYSDEPINNSFFLNVYEPCPSCRDAIGQPIPNAVEGLQFLQTPTPSRLNQRAVSFNSSAYVNDTWKPRPNLTLQIGVRIDREDVDSSGFSFFNPRDEKRKSINTLESLCADGLRVSDAGNGGTNDTANAVCDVTGRIPGTIVGNNLVYEFDQDTPDRLRKFDVDNDGVFDSGSPDGQPWLSPYTTFPDRLPENFNITNLNLSPRFSVSWDPWADGKTKIFTTWGRFYDRLFLSTVSGEIGPDTISYEFRPDTGTFQFEADSRSQSVSAVSVQQIERNLTTPYTDVFTFGLEREIAPEWSARVTFTQRLGWNLLQDVDFNHILCTEFDEQFGIDPAQVCRSFTDANGKVHLSDDLFGGISQGPNTAPDLYNVNQNFNQILRVGNFNDSRYRSFALELNKRLHRNWQMQASYTYSRAQGQAENFGSALGNDPSTRDDEEGFLSFDQRHRALLIATTHLPKDVELGGSVRWESGTPFSIVAQTVDSDDVGNSTFRTFFPTRQRNDQRNGGFWAFDTKLVKRFIIGNVQAAAELSVQNLFNHDDLTLGAFRVSSFSGVALVQGPQGLRRFGRIWELGMTLNF